MLREQARLALEECLRTGEALLTQAEIVDNSGGHNDWIYLCAKWKERTIAELRLVYDGDEMPDEFDAVTFTIERSSPRFTFPTRIRTLERGLLELRDLVERLPLAIEPEVTRRDIPDIPSRDSRSPYGTRPTAELVTEPEDHFLEHTD